MKPPALSYLLCALALLVATSSAQTWTRTSAPSNSWNALACSADGSHVVASARSGYTGLIFLSTDSGATWIPTSATMLAWTSLACSADGTKLAAASANAPGRSIFTSADSGSTWKSNAVPLGNLVFGYLFGRRVEPGRGLFYRDVYRSTNAGTSWTANPASMAHVSQVAVSPAWFVKGNDRTMLWLTRVSVSE
jgi:hypothetical protein